MKKVVLMTLALLTFGLMSAQNDSKIELPKESHRGFAQGDMFISGSVGYSSVSNPDHSKENRFNISPRFGYFVNDFFAVGGRLGYVSDVQKDADGHKYADNSTFTIGAFGRYYLLPGSKFSPFAELAIGFGTTKNINDYKNTGINAAFSPGLSYFLGHHFALEASFGVLSYNTVSPKRSSGSTDEFKIGIDLEDINFGIIYKF